MSDKREPDDFDVEGFARPFHGHPGHWEQGHAHPSGDKPHSHEPIEPEVRPSGTQGDAT